MRLAYLHTPEAMLVAHKEALALMSELNAHPNPVNYHLFYEYALGEHPEFNAFVDAMRSNQEPWSDILGVRLTERFFKERERTIASVEQELMHAIGEMTDNVSKHVDTHFELAQALESNPEKAPLISAHLKKANRLLSHEVKDSKQRVDATRARLIEHKKHTMTDLLTRLHNATHMNEFLPVIVKRARSSGKHVVLALIDIDHFADYNARYGHHRGDSLLRGYAKILASLGEGAHAWRLSGDEFVLTMVMKSDAPIRNLIKRVHNQLASVHFKASSDREAVPAQSVSMVVDLVADQAATTLNHLDELMKTHRDTGTLNFTDELSAIL